MKLAKPPNLSKVTFLTPGEAQAALDLHESRYSEEWGTEDELLAARVDHVYSLMLSHRWITPKTNRDLSAIWGIGMAAIARIEGEARRRFRHIVDPEEARGVYIAQLEYIVADAMNAEHPVVNNKTGEVTYVKKPDRRSAIAGIREAADMLGLKKKTIEHNHKVVQQPLSELLEEANRRLKEESLDTTGTDTTGNVPLLDGGYPGESGPIDESGGDPEPD